MNTRPIYIGFGTCSCGRIEVKLYRLSDRQIREPLLCPLCLEKAGYAVPTPRTADDIETIDGKLEWKK